MLLWLDGLCYKCRCKLLCHVENTRRNRLQLKMISFPLPRCNLFHKCYNPIRRSVQFSFPPKHFRNKLWSHPVGQGDSYIVIHFPGESPVSNIPHGCHPSGPITHHRGLQFDRCYRSHISHFSF